MLSVQSVVVVVEVFVVLASEELSVSVNPRISKYCPLSRGGLPHGVSSLDGVDFTADVGSDETFL